MRILVFFDLPTEPKKLLRQSRAFRKALLKDGFQMLQESVYIRVCIERSEAEKHRRRLIEVLPDEGNVWLLLLTEQQFAASEILLGPDILKNQTCSKLLVI